MTSVGIFIGKLNESQQQPNAEIAINGLKENYTANDPITFYVKIYGYGSGCGDTHAIIKKENDSKFESPVWGFGTSCASSVQLHNFNFSALPVNTSINEAGNYVLTASFDDSITLHHAVSARNFTIILPHPTLSTELKGACLGGIGMNCDNAVVEESINLSAYRGTSNEVFYNNGTVVSYFDVDVKINNFKPSDTSLLLQIYYNDGTLYKTVKVSSDMIQPDGFYKYKLIAISDKNHPVPFKVVATYNNNTAIGYAPVFAHP